ncbi:MAG: hypothetical protein OEZ36_01665 [Spirochaetota bacterium]|nr:hypothetical protein [Spirochaetota bacterium]
MDTNQGLSGDFRDEIFRINCVEISSELINQDYEEYPILLVDNALKDEDREAYEDYICYGRKGMPSWKDYYAIKNLVETLEEIDGLDNKDASDLLSRVEESFLNTLFSRISVDKEVLDFPLKKVFFHILQKLEFFYPDDDRLIKYLLMIDTTDASKAAFEDALAQYQQIFQDDHYFQSNEKLLVELIMNYFHNDNKKVFNEKLKLMDNDRAQDKLSDYLSKVNVF